MRTVDERLHGFEGFTFCTDRFDLGMLAFLNLW
jgi:hypothetical protein